MLQHRDSLPRLPASVRALLCVVLAAVMAWPLPLLAQGQPADVQERELVAMLDFDSVGASKPEEAAITDRVREELLRTGRFTVVDRGQIETILQEQALQQTGCTTQECAVQVGQILGVRKIISGRITKISDTQWLVSAQMIDVETARTLRAESLRHRGDFFDLMDTTIASLAAKLTGVEKPNAPAIVQATPPPPQPSTPTLAQLEEEGSGFPWWGWLLVIVGIGAVAAVAGGSSDSSTDATGSSGSGNTVERECTAQFGCGGVTVSW